METKLDYNGFRKYFEPHSKLPKIIGCVIVALGAVGVIIGGFMMFFGFLLIVGGLCVIVFVREARPSDEQLDDAIAKKVKDLEDTAKHDIDVRERLIKAFPPTGFKNYDMTGVEDDAGRFLIRRGDDNKYRTNKYSATEILFAQELLHVYMMRFYLTEDESEETKKSVRYKELGKAWIDKRQAGFVMSNDKGKGSVTLDYQVVIIENEDGSTFIEIPVSEGADVDRTVETINHLIKAKKEGNVNFS